MRTQIVAALVLAATPVFAAQAEDFTRDGETYHYVAARQPNGAVRLTGAAQDGGQFDLTVRNRRVEGVMDGAPVNFAVSKATVASLDAEVAGGTQTAAAN